MSTKYDLIVIGAGPGGYTAAIRARNLGMSVAVVEKSRIGGNCVNRGCIPTKALLHVSELFSKMTHSDEFGVSIDGISFDYSHMMDYKKRSVRLYREEIRNLFDEKRIDVIEGSATIRYNKMVEVNSESGKTYYEAENIIIATGAKPVVPNIPGIDLKGVIDSDRLLKSEKWNYNRIVILGGGVIGIELATVFIQLCSKVTIIERESNLLSIMDKEVCEALENELRDKGINIYTDTTVTSITDEDGLVINAQESGNAMRIKTGCIIVAVGRRPYTEGLDGGEVQIERDEAGRIKTDENFQTNVQGIYAIGDVAAKKQLAHVAAAEGTFVVEHIAKADHTIRLEVVPNGMYVALPIVPSCIYTNPEIASVGLTEEAAKKANLKIVCGRYMMKGNSKSIIEDVQYGFIRLIFEAFTMSIVGAQMVCPRATDMIGEMATAIANSLTAGQLIRAMRPHPTYSEGITHAILDAMRKRNIMDVTD